MWCLELQIKTKSYDGMVLNALLTEYIFDFKQNSCAKKKKKKFHRRAITVDLKRVFRGLSYV